MQGGHSIIERARGLRRDTTQAEQLLWDGLRNDRLGVRFRRQHPIPPYIVDFACVEAKLIVEADGGQHSRDGDHEIRDNQLRQSGWHILRFWNNDIFENREGVLQMIADALNSSEAGRTPTLTLPACGEGSEEGSVVDGW